MIPGDRCPKCGEMFFDLSPLPQVCIRCHTRELAERTADRRALLRKVAELNPGSFVAELIEEIEELQKALAESRGEKESKP
jgi:hypothetical protein